MGIGVIPEPQPNHNQIFIGIHKEYLTPDAHCIVARELRLIGSDAAGVVPAEVVTLVVLGISRRLLNPGFAYNPSSIPFAAVQIKAADFGKVPHRQGQTAESVCRVMLLAVVIHVGR